MPKIEIDGISVDVESGTTIIEVADRLKIPIPRFCYHNKLSVAANCRMCLVQVEKAPKALPACATPVADGMKIWTQSADTKAAQRAVMEYLLINHPLDCPICDQGGECELQDVSMQYGRGDSRFNEPKRVVVDENLGSLIETEMTRCIQCTRCVRFGSEVSGERELGAVDRGEHMEISTYVEHTLNSEVSGNIIDLCPVGALTSKPYRFSARAWELTAVAGISPHDCIGSNLYWHSLRGKIKRVVPKDAEELNEVWLSDRDRFSYQSIYHIDRLHKPLLNKQRWNTVQWDVALGESATSILQTIEKYGPDNIGILISPSVSNEEYFLLHKIFRELGCNNIDHRLRQLDFKDQELAPKYPNLGIDFRSLMEQESILLIGCDIAKEQPLASLRIRKMVKNGGKVCAINAVDYKYNFKVEQKIVTPINELIETLAAVVKAVLQNTKQQVSIDVTDVLAKIAVTDEAQQIASCLLSVHKKQIILGHIATMHPQASQIIALANLLAQLTNGTIGAFSDGANAAGAWIYGCVPHRSISSKNKNIGLNAREMLQTPLKAYVLYGIDPEFDSILGAYALNSINKAEFVLAINSYQSDTLLEVSDVILPLATASEYDGSMININGDVQHFVKAAMPFGESKEGWKILRMLGKFLNLTGFTFNTLQEIQTHMQETFPHDGTLPKWEPQTLRTIVSIPSTDLMHIAPISLYAIDGMTRRSQALQATRDAQSAPLIIINNAMAKHYNVVAKEQVLVSNGYTKEPVQLEVEIDDRVADFTAIIYQANVHSLTLGAPYTKLEVRKC